MSATIADDSEIVRAFGASADAVGKPITSTSLAGVGERMILIPELMKLGGAAITPMVKNHRDQARREEARRGHPGALWARLPRSGPTSPVIRARRRTSAEQIDVMQAGASFGPIVLANRYDGIDLAGNACRFLVMDNLPQGTSDYDIYRMNVVADFGGQLTVGAAD